MKKITAKEIFDMGLLFEINRAVLHPLGLALEVIVQDDGTTTFGEVWDARDDPDGWLFGEEGFEEGSEKFEAFMAATGQEVLRTRFEALGFIHQTLASQGQEDPEEE